MPSETVELNPQQAEAVRHVTGPLLVLAPVGTGKTTVIACRAAHAVEAGIDPSSILCLSFTNRAARQVRERITASLSRHAGEVTVRTFHALCAHILRHEADALGLASDFTICDEEDAKELLVALPAAACLQSDDAVRLGRVLTGLANRLAWPTSSDGSDLDPRAILDDLVEQEQAVIAGLELFDPQQLAQQYRQALRDHNYLDFAGLISEVARLFRERSDRVANWQRLYTWIQVDEVQDTSGQDYQIISRLAEQHRNLALFGDIDQTIYEWRDSRPFEIVRQFKETFGPVREIALTTNYRSMRHILQACTSFIQALPGAVTKRLDGALSEPGWKVCVHGEPTLRGEAQWIARQIREAKEQHRLRNQDFAVLTRTNYTAAEFSKVFAEERVEHFVIEQLRFFRRPEIKDALAAMRVLVNRFDDGSLLRLLKRLPGWAPPAAFEEVRKLQPEVGLRLNDFLDPNTRRYGDPFGALLEGIRGGAVVVFDVEATGLDVTRDEIVELAAVRAGSDGVVRRFHAYLRNSLPVGASAAVHGFTDEFLAANGRPPAEVLTEFLEFARGGVAVGHNVGYDLNLLNSQLGRLGLERWQPAACYDTLDMARRFYRLQRYTLAHLCKELGLARQPTHHAIDDVEATWLLARRMLPGAARFETERREVIARRLADFAALQEQFRGWATRLEEERPVAILRAVLNDSPLGNYWRGQPDGERRVKNLRELVELFERYDERGLPPRESMLELVNLVALGNDADRYAGREDRVLLLTAHQAKGLEFDTVFIGGATDTQFPSYHSTREGKLDEEHRLFYVALTRARRQVFVTYHERDARDRSQPPSRFIDRIPARLREDV